MNPRTSLLTAIRRYKELFQPDYASSIFVDVLNVVECMLTGAAVISFQSEKTDKGVWLISGPKKTPVVTLRYENERADRNEEHGDVDVVPVKVEIDEDRESDSLPLPSDAARTTTTSPDPENAEPSPADSDPTDRPAPPGRSSVISSSCREKPVIELRTQNKGLLRPNIPSTRRKLLKPRKRKTGFETFRNATDNNHEISYRDCQYASFCDANDNVQKEARNSFCAAEPNQNADDRHQTEQVDETSILNAQNVFFKEINLVNIRDAAARSMRPEPSSEIIIPDQAPLHVDVVIHEGSAEEAETRTCCHCSEEFVLLESLKAHEKRCPKKVRTYQCSYCDRKLDTISELISHKTEEHGDEGDKRLECSQCKKTFSKSQKLTLHNAVVHRGEKPYSCPTCGKKFAAAFNLKIHERIHTGERPYKCSHCDKTFYSSSEVRVHERTHTGEKPYTCSQCGKSFTALGSLKAHKRIHTGERPYQCSYCDQTFIVSSKLKKHEMTHTGERPYLCSVCGLSFVRPIALKEHMTTHTGEGIYQCSYCDEKFTRRMHKKAHERTHTGEGPIQCFECDKTFFTQQALVMHQKVHTGEKPFKCAQCDKAFSALHYLKFHEKVHSGENRFECSICNLKLAGRENWKRHQRVHTGERPFQCSVCGNSFAVKDTLKLHERTHTGERPYVCTICGKTFAVSSSLRRHERDIHKLNKHEYLHCENE